jgi:DNA primase
VGIALSDEIKERVRSQTDLVGLIGEVVALKPIKGGREFVGLCPFHDDHNPSFHVYPDRQSYRCWVCNDGGDCFSFVMQRERVEFREALEMLARRANLPMPKSLRRTEADVPEKTTLYDVLGWAEREFHECLLNAPFAAKAREYLAGRGFTDETVRRFRLGYHPDNWEWLLDRAARGLSGKRFTAEQLESVRLAVKRTNGAGYFDCFVDRVMFPIHDERGRPVAFGGRVLPGSKDSEGRKYMNSAEHALFPKSRMLFGFNLARDAITKTETAVVMEGYTDCIMAHQSGMPNVVATLGTALTEHHVTVLKRFARKVVLVFDSDQAGQDATERALSKFLSQEVDLRILTLIGQDGAAKIDPADYLLQNGGASFSRLVNGAVEAWEHKLQRSIERMGLDSIDSRHRVLKEMLEVLAHVARPATSAGADWQVRENIILGKLTHRLGLSEHVVREQLQTLRKKPNMPSSPAVLTPAPGRSDNKLPADATPRSGPPVPRTRDDKAEFDLLAVVVTCPQALLTVRDAIQPDDLRNVSLRELLQVCLDLQSRGIEPSYENLTTCVEDLGLKRTAAQVCEHGRNVHANQSLLAATLRYLQQRHELHPADPAAAAPHLPPHSGTLDDDSKALLRRVTERLKNRSHSPN